MAQKTTLNQADIQRWTGESSFSRGRSYFRRGAIIHPRRQGDILKAQCYGSMSQPYRLEVTLASHGIATGHCSCPVGGAGRCKHVAALLLTWLDNPDAFIETEEMETGLAQRSKDELIALVQKMIARYPDLEMMLELPVPAQTDPQQPLDPEVIQRQVQHAFNSLTGEWGAAYDLSMELESLVEIGDQYRQQENYRDATTVYDNVIRETLERYGWAEDHDGHLHGVVNRCVSGLGECLAATTNPELRETILQALFYPYRWDIDYGGIDMGYEAVDIILEQASAAERQKLVAWTQAALPKGESWTTDFRRSAYGGFLLTLQENTLDDEAFLELCRQTGRLNDLVDRLLSLKRVDEAVAEAQQVEDYPLLTLASIFVAHGHGDLIEGIVRDRLPTSKDSRLMEWLKQRLVEKNDLTAALALEKQLFWHRPDTGSYQKLKELAQAVGQWDTLREDILARLTQEEKYALLTQIYLLESEVGQALKTLPLAKHPSWGWHVSASLPIQVAKAAEADYPREAIDLYMKQIKRLIDARGRGNYAQAAQYLLRVRQVYKGTDQLDNWKKLIKDLREENRQLPAFQDELRQAGL